MTFCRETLKYGTLCRETLKYALWAEKCHKLRSEPIPHFNQPWSCVQCKSTITGVSFSRNFLLRLLTIHFKIWSISSSHCNEIKILHQFWWSPMWSIVGSYNIWSIGPSLKPKHPSICTMTWNSTIPNLVYPQNRTLNFVYLCLCVFRSNLIFDVVFVEL